MPPEGRVIVVGGNVGGLATAIALKKFGVPVLVLERMSQLPSVPGGLHIWTNGAQTMAWLGVLDRIMGEGEPLHTVEFRTWTGEVFARAELAEAIATYGNSPFFVPRVEVTRGLFAAVDDGVVQFGSQCVGFDQSDSGVTVRLADGGEVQGSVLVGADGINSTVRAGLMGDTVRPRYAGFQDWGAVVEYSTPKFPPGALRIFWGRGSRVGMAHIGRGRIYWAASVKRPETETEPPAIADLLEQFRGWGEPIEELIEATDPEAFYGAPIREVPPMKRWTEGRTILIGDAAHAMQPNLGRGASEALEDAIVLASKLARAGDLRDQAAVDALRSEYESQRMRAVYTIAKRSRQMGQLGQWQSDIGATARQLYLRGIFPIVLRTMVSDFKKNFEESLRPTAS